MRAHLPKRGKNRKWGKIQVSKKTKIIENENIISIYKLNPVINFDT